MMHLSLQVHTSHLDWHGHSDTLVGCASHHLYIACSTNNVKCLPPSLPPDRNFRDGRLTWGYSFNSKASKWQVMQRVKVRVYALLMWLKSGRMLALIQLLSMRPGNAHLSPCRLVHCYAARCKLTSMQRLHISVPATSHSYMS